MSLFFAQWATFLIQIQQRSCVLAKSPLPMILLQAKQPLPPLTTKKSFGNRCRAYKSIAIGGGLGYNFNMRRRDILNRLSRHRPNLEVYGVKSLAIFGSVARGEEKADSDVDVLVEFKGSASFDRYMGLRFYLEKLLHRPVDLLTRRAVRPELRTMIEREAIYVP